MPHRGKSTRPDQIDTRNKAIVGELRIKALELRKAGATYRAIGAQLGINHETARAYILAAIKELKALQDEEAEEFRQLELERLDRLQAAHWGAAIGSGGTPNLESGKMILKCIELRARLLGLFVEKQELTGAGGDSLRVEVVYAPFPRQIPDELD